MPGKFKETAYLPAQGLQEFVERSAEEKGMSKSRYLGSLVEKEAASVSVKTSRPALVLHTPYLPDQNFVCSGAFEYIPRTAKSDFYKYVMLETTNSIISGFKGIIQKQLKDNPEYLQNACFVLLRNLIKGVYKKSESGSLIVSYNVKVTLIRVSEKEWLKYDGCYDFFKIKYYSYYDLTTKTRAGGVRMFVPVSDEKYKDGAFFIPVSDASSNFQHRIADDNIKGVGLDNGEVAKCIILGVDNRSVSERFSVIFGEKTNNGLRTNSGRRYKVFK
ncbi:hypothetical protein [Hafnia paralvei]|uniref:hypothetical protein n=1 Tax=Hafnia paralvei TaxID=546367 RepID=UPI0024BA1D45|nr:hypothetical protein [Hafnia paralvei]